MKRNLKIMNLSFLLEKIIARKVSHWKIYSIKNRLDVNSSIF